MVKNFFRVMMLVVLLCVVSGNVMAFKEDPINPHVEKLVDFYVRDVAIYDGLQHKFRLQMPKAEVKKIMEQRKWNEISDKVWDEEKYLTNAHKFNLSEQEITKTLKKLKGTSELSYKTSIPINPSKFDAFNIQMFYRFTFRDNELICCDLELFPRLPIGDDGGNNILNKSYQVIYSLLGATDPTAWLKLGTAGVWISRDFKEKIELKSGVLERKIKFDEIKKIVQEKGADGLKTYTGRDFYYVKISRFSRYREEPYAPAN